MRKSFIMYTDALQVLDELDDAQAGRLFKAIKAFQLDDPSADELLKSDIVTRLAFIPFKSSFERDIEKYNEKVERLQKNVSRNRNDIDTKSERSRDDIGTKSVGNRNDIAGVNVNDNVSVNVSVNDKSKDKEKTNVNVSKKESEKVEVAAEAATSARKEKFYASLVPFVDKYGKDMIREFFDYWSEMNRSKSKMRFEQQSTWELALRLKTWADREKIPKKEGNPKVGVILTDNSLTKYKKEDLWK